MVKTLSWVSNPKMPRAESRRDSKVVAQNLVSPLMGSSSHCPSVYSIALAWGESMEKEKNSRRYGSCLDEKGMVSASSLDSNLGDFEGSFSGKYMALFSQLLDHQL